MEFVKDPKSAESAESAKRVKSAPNESDCHDNQSQSNELLNGATGTESKARAKARWKILRQALLGAANVGNHPSSNHVNNIQTLVSIHRFPGFQMLKQRVISPHSSYKEESCDDISPLHDEAVYHDRLRHIYISNKLMERVRNMSTTMSESSIQHVKELILVQATALVHYQCFSNPPLNVLNVILSASFEYALELNQITDYLIEKGIIINPENHPESSISAGHNAHVHVQIPFSYIITNNQTQTSILAFHCIEYMIPLTLPEHTPLESRVDATTTAQSYKFMIGIRVRERKRAGYTNNPNRPSKMDLKALTSERHYGVDNTGNTRIWDSENTLTYCLFSSQTKPPMLHLHHILSLAVPVPVPVPVPVSRSSSSDTNKTKSSSYNKILNVIELGAGMAGLAGLALAAFHRSGQSQGIKINVVITDGHPDAVFSNQINASMTSSLYDLGDDLGDDLGECNSIHSARLLWNKNASEGEKDCSHLRTTFISQYNDDDHIHSANFFQLCLVSDCLHFQDFHAALISTIARLLCVGGICILCQPHRGNSLNNFLSLLQSLNTLSSSSSSLTPNNDDLFHIQHVQDYHPIVSEMDLKFKKEIPNIYDPNIHYPHMIILTKLREYDEVKHGGIAIDFLKKRK